MSMSNMEQMAAASRSRVTPALSEEQAELARYLASEWASGPAALATICRGCEAEGQPGRRGIRSLNWSRRKRARHEQPERDVLVAGLSRESPGQRRETR